MSSSNLIFFSDPKTTAVINHLCSLFVTFCRSQSERISQRTSQLTIRFLLLNPKWKDVLRHDVSKSEIQDFMEACFHFLFEDSVSSTTYKIQLLFYGRYLSREQFKDHKKQVVMKNCFHLLQKLKKVWHNPSEDLHYMHNDLVKLILIKEGMDDKDDPTAFEEMKTAVSSVFPVSALSTFVASNQKAKMAFINEVSLIATGKRLHAWYSNKAGKYMFDVGQIMKETLPKICEDLHEEFYQVNKRVGSLQKSLKEKVCEGTSEKDINFYQEKVLLIHLTNFLKFLKVLKEDIDEIGVQTYKLDYKFIIEMKDLSAALKVGPFTKADRAYPLYKDVAKTWKNMQIEGHLLDFYIKLYFDLKKFSESMKLPKTDGEEIILPVAEYQDTNVSAFQEASEDKLTVILPDDVKNFSEITLQYQEFCPYYCSMAILVPCNRYLGIVMYKGLCYGFSSEEAMNSFKQQPKKYIDEIRKCLLIIPDLIITLCMEASFQFPIVNNFKSTQVLPIFITDSCVQTVLHPIEENIDYSYCWNQWDLRKQALKYIDIENKKTHSTQTDLSHFRRENYSQVYLPKDNWTQTRRETGTTMPRTGIPELYRRIRRSFL